jgi:NAD(P)-dependent dehydrogenase (short-subunit alcohol dehydrogenase family)
MRAGGRRFAGRTVIVTGSGRGVGRATAQRFAAEGAHVSVVGRTVEPLADTVDSILQAGGTAWSMAADIASPDDVDALVSAAMERWTSIDVLVNNAAVFGEPTFFDNDAETFRRILDVNLTGTFVMSQRVAREMAHARSGAIVHISSVDASGADGPNSAYTASKAAVVSLARTMAVELAPLGIRTNVVSPGYINTAMARQTNSPAVIDYMLHRFDRVPLRRLVEPEEIAAAVAFLASPDASAITGANLVVDCGMTANLYAHESKPRPTRAEAPGDGTTARA